MQVRFVGRGEWKTGSITREEIHVVVIVAVEILRSIVFGERHRSSMRQYSVGRSIMIDVMIPTTGADQ